MNIILGTRGSKLALAQSMYVQEQLQQAFPMHHYEIKKIITKGDQIQHVALDKIGDKGVFVEALEHQLKTGEIQLAVHSMKDLPSYMDEQFSLYPFMQGEDVRDALVLRNCDCLAALPIGARIATGSKRRATQLLKLRSDLQIVGIRGNVDTRLAIMEKEQLDGIVLAAAGLHRLHLHDRITSYFSVEEMIPACMQGVLGIQICKGNEELEHMLQSLVDDKIALRMRMERSYLANVEGSCHIPVGSYCDIQDQQIVFHAIYGNEESSHIVRMRKAFAKEETKIGELMAELVMKEMKHE